MKSILYMFLGFLIVLLASASALGQETTGWVPNPKATEAFASTIPVVYGSQVSDLVSADKDGDALLYRSLVPCLEDHGLTDWIKRRGDWKVARAYNQGNAGTCVGNATAACLSVLNAFEVQINRESQIFTAMHSADGMYGLAREAAGMLRYGDGCTGSGAAKAITTMGSLYCIKYKNVDLTTNVPSRARQYGSSGVGSDLLIEAEKHKVMSVYRVKSATEAWSLIGNGYPINVCSGRGFSKQRNAEGICQPSGTWNHSMAIIARRTTSDGRKLFLIWNSWGDNWASGPYWQDMPEGSFWAEYTVVDGMMRSGDCFAYSGLEGFAGRNLPDYGSKYYLGKLKYKESDDEKLSCNDRAEHDRLGRGSGNEHEFGSGDATKSGNTLSVRTVPRTGLRDGNGVQAVRFSAP